MLPPDGPCAFFSERYHWDPAETTRWLICRGMPPGTPSVTAEYRVVSGRRDSTSRIVLTVDPIVTPAQLAEAYSKARQPVVPPSRQRVRPTEVKAAKLAKFALEQSEDIESAPSERWRVAWNKGATIKENSDWLCGDQKYERDNFARAVKKAYERLSHEGWRVPSDSRRGQRRGQTLNPPGWEEYE
jgi:hypothetical protein